MDSKIVEYIRNEIALGHDVQSIAETLKNNNIDQTTINEAFRLAMQPVYIDPKIPENQTATTAINPAKPEKKHFDATKAFLIIGALLISAAVIIVIYSQWSNVGPFARICFLGLPMFLLFVISWFLSTKDDYKETSDWTLGVGSFIIPFFIGTFLYQVKLIDNLDSSLFLVTAILSLPIYIVLEYILKKSYLSVFTILMIYVFFISLFVNMQMETLPISWLLLLLSLALTGLGFWLMSRKTDNYKGYLSFGTMASAILLPTATLLTLNDPSSLSLGSNMIILSIFGFLYLFLASFYNGLRSYFTDDILYSLKRMFEEIAPVVIIIPFLFAGAESSSYNIAAFVLSILAIILSIKIWINSFLYIGSLGLIISVLMISGQLFVDSIGWPILVFIAGFAAIGIGLTIKRIVGLHKENNSQMMFLGLGKDPSVNVDAEKFSLGRVILALLLVFFGLPVIYYAFIIFSGYSYRNDYSEESNNAMQTSEYKTIEQDTVIPEPKTETNVVSDTVDGAVAYLKYDSSEKLTAAEAVKKIDGNYNRITVKDNKGEMHDFFIDLNTTFTNQSKALSRNISESNLSDFRNAQVTFVIDGSGYYVASAINFY